MHSSNKSFNFGKHNSSDKKVLNKKVPGNPKYENIKPAINTGCTVRKQIDELREKQKNCLHKKDEIYNRIKFLNFIELLVESNIVKLKLDREKAHAEDIIPFENSMKSNGKRHPDEILPNVIMGIGEVDLANQKRNPSSAAHKLEKELPYLLLDVRDKEQFIQNRIKTAFHYPSALLARSGFETEEMKLYKNSCPEIIILYDDDESITDRVATTLVQRGYDNIFVLTGGLKHCLTVFPKIPLSRLCTNLLPDLSLSGSPTVIIRNAFSDFSQEDIDVMEMYVDLPKNEPNCQDTRSGSSLSRSAKLGFNQPDGALGSKHKAGSSTHRRDSDSSLKSFDQTRLKLSKSALDSRSKGGKKAPWK